jgi:hypothetical protein
LHAGTYGPEDFDGTDAADAVLWSIDLQAKKA